MTLEEYFNSNAGNICSSLLSNVHSKVIHGGEDLEKVVAESSQNAILVLWHKVNNKDIEEWKAKARQTIVDHNEKLRKWQEDQEQTRKDLIEKISKVDFSLLNHTELYSVWSIVQPKPQKKEKR